MHKLEITTPGAIREALRQEGEHSSQSRFVHRLHCLVLVGSGTSCYEVATAFGDDPRSVERWVHEYEQFGIEALKEHPHPGRHSILTHAQMQDLEAAFDGVPGEQGPAADAWTGKLLRAEILRRFGVKLSARHCQRLRRILYLKGQREAQAR